mmetsp:Transcript_36738/g.113283  ORF Transcript_36738/g.113283 Transcript_36738/m.113283 type:complete len:175 (-) Transcript_36738:484-1008(-)
MQWLSREALGFKISPGNARRVVGDDDGRLFSVDARGAGSPPPAPSPTSAIGACFIGTGSGRRPRFFGAKRAFACSTAESDFRRRVGSASCCSGGAPRAAEAERERSPLRDRSSDDRVARGVGDCLYFGTWPGWCGLLGAPASALPRRREVHGADGVGAMDALGDNALVAREPAW